MYPARVRPLTERADQDLCMLVRIVIRFVTISERATAQRHCRAHHFVHSGCGNWG